MNLPKISKWKIALIIGVIFLSIGIAYAVTVSISNTVHINSAATITLSTSSFNWGNLDPSESATRTVTLTNNGDSATAVLTFETDNPTGGTLTWDASGKTIPAHTSLPVIFTYVAGSSSGDYSWNINITG